MDYDLRIDGDSVLLNGEHVATLVVTPGSARDMIVAILESGVPYGCSLPFRISEEPIRC